jgi:predicted phosphodiesterase
VKNRILIVGDLHMPYHNKQAMRKLYETLKQLKPTHIVQIGDLYDQYSFSRFTKKNITTSTQELRRARNDGVQFWKQCKKLARSANCYQLLGNHDIRLTKRIADKVPEAYEFVKEELNRLYTFEGVKTIYDERELLKIGNVSFHHGYLSQLGAHSKSHGCNIVVGHSHTGGVVFEQRAGKIIWELNAGYLADEASEPLRYRPTKTSKWTLGVGFIDSFGPRFIPFK